MPAISIICPVYKAEKYIHKCIDSVLAQTFTDFELLLIDDGSPDSSGQICDEYAERDSRVRVFHKENGGVASARQVGLDNACGEYTIHVDPDDWVEPNMLEELYAKAKETDADMVICDFYTESYIPRNQKYIKQAPTSLSSNIVLRNLFEHLHGSLCNKLIKLECFRKNNIRFNQEFSFCEDLCINIAVISKNIIISYLPKAFYHYVINNPNSLVNKFSEKIYKEDIIMHNYILNQIEDPTTYNICKKKIITNFISRAYWANIWDSAEFKERMYVYKNIVINNRERSILFRVKLYLSCVGLYRPMRILNNIYLSVKNTILGILYGKSKHRLDR